MPAITQALYDELQMGGWINWCPGPEDELDCPSGNETWINDLRDDPRCSRCGGKPDAEDFVIIDPPEYPTCGKCQKPMTEIRGLWHCNNCYPVKSREPQCGAGYHTCGAKCPEGEN